MCFYFILLFHLQTHYLYNKNNEPSSYGISEFIKNNIERLISEYEYKVDSIYDVSVFAENSSEFDSLELGLFYLPDCIYISTQEKYVEYEFKNLSKYKQRNLQPFQRTVKGVLFHELSHAYFYQTIFLMKYDSIKVSPEYNSFRILPTVSTQYGAEFIEEGFCEYVLEMVMEQPIHKIFTPECKNDLLNKEHEIEIKYGYSVYFLRDFLNENGIKNGLRIILSNRPPNYDEILKPELYYNRLE